MHPPASKVCLSGSRVLGSPLCAQPLTALSQGLTHGGPSPDRGVVTTVLFLGGGWGNGGLETCRDLPMMTQLVNPGAGLLSWVCLVAPDRQCCVVGGDLDLSHSLLGVSSWHTGMGTLVGRRLMEMGAG